jgi:hypothetical protein
LPGDAPESAEPHTSPTSEGPGKSTRPGPGSRRDTAVPFPEAPPFRVSIDLVDGSRIVGVPGIESVRVRTARARMDIALDRIARVVIADDRETAAFALQSGDRIEGVLDLPSIGMKTVFGEVSIGVEHVHVITVRLKTGDIRYGANTTVRTEMYEALHDDHGRIPRYTKHEVFGNSKCFTELLRRAKTTLIQPMDNPKRRYKYVHSGTHEYPTLERVRNNWISVMIRAGGLTCGVRIDDFNLMFTDGHKSLNDAIAGGYIEPLVIVDSYHGRYAWRNPTVIADGTSPTETRDYPTILVTFKVKDREEFTGVKFHSNQDFSKRYDGLLIYRFPSDYDISSHRIDEDKPRDVKKEKWKMEVGDEVF